MSQTPPEALIEGMARVVAVEGGLVRLESQRQASCGGCASAKSCGVSSLAGVFGRKAITLTLPNDFDAAIGETVVIGIPQSAVMRASLLAYLLPVVAAVLGAVLGAAGGDLFAALGAGLGLAAGLVGANLLAPRFLSPEKLRPVYLRRAGFEAPADTSCTLDGGKGT